MTPFEKLFEDHREFTDSVFTGITNWRGPFEHMRTEIDEVIETGEKEEFADILFLLFSGFRLRFPNLDSHDLLKIASEKLKVLKTRDWGEVNDKGFVEHIDPEWLIDVNNKDYYNVLTENRTRERLIRIAKSGMSEIDDNEFGVPGVISGFSIQQVWNETDEEFENYMDWAENEIAITIPEGSKVTYIGNPISGYQHGVAFRQCTIEDEFVPVVFNCGGNWDQFKDYTAQRCPRGTIVKGWRDQEPRFVVERGEHGPTRIVVDGKKIDSPEMFGFVVHVAKNEGWQWAFDLVEYATGKTWSLDDMIDLCDAIYPPSPWKNGRRVKVVSGGHPRNGEYGMIVNTVASGMKPIQVHFGDAVFDYFETDQLKLV